MSFSDLYTPGFRNRNRDHFAAIVRIALADGVISAEEMAFIKRTAINLEIEDIEYQHIIDNAKDYPINPPAEKKKRIERLYDLTRIVYADNIADDKEKELLKRIVIGLGFATDEANTIVKKALNIICDCSDEDDFVEAFF
tara:strand:- start:6639 stop:7058 length:420 start_codon:yes stop_codon:yes gene_type:complete